MGWIYSVVDAGKAAERTNKKRGLGLLPGVLREDEVGVGLGVVEGGAVGFGFDVPVVPHFGEFDLNAGLVCFFADLRCPVFGPLRVAAGFVVHAVEDVVVLQ